jgi:N-acetylmuramoyl-L-alanine amidase CwlD
MSRYGSYSKASSSKKLAATILTILQGLVFVQPSLAGQPSLPSPRKFLPLNRTDQAPSLIPITGYQNGPSSFTISYVRTKQTIQAPAIQYLPGYDGETIMVCDFPLLNWTEPTCVIPFAPTPGIKGIKQIRIGQFQANPPILRIAITTTDPTLLTKVSINATDDKLVFRWTSPKPSPQLVSKSQATILPNPQEPPIAPSFARPKTTTLAPQLVPIAKPDTITAPLAKSLPDKALPAVQQPQKTEKKNQNTGQGKDIDPYEQTETYVKSAWLFSKKSFKSWFNTKPEAVTSNKQTNPKQETAVRAAHDNQPLPEHQVARTEIDNSEDLAFRINEAESSLEIESKNPIRYKAFSLNDPPRYVIDFEGLPDLSTAKLPTLVQKGPIKNLRIGNPNANLEPSSDREGQNASDLPATRLVIDLDPSGLESLAVTDKLNNASTTLTISLGGGIPKFTGELPNAPHGKVIVLDAGHGGSDPGAQRGVIQEKEITLAITQKLEKILQAKGIRTIMTRSDDTFVSLQDRVAITNRIKPDAFVSVHINSLETTSDIHGIETYYQTAQSQNLAQLIHQSLVGNLQVPDRYIRKARFYVINHTEVPSILAEVGFISNVKEREKLISPDYQNQIAESLARGVILYLNERPIAQNKAPNQSPRTLAQHGQ